MISYRKYIPGDESQISLLIRIVYDIFIAQDYSETGNIEFYKFIDPVRILERQDTGHNIYLALDANRIIGILESRNMNHISLLFVDKNYQGKGIAKSLFKNFLGEIPKDIATIDVHASPFSIPIYEKLGFRGIGSMKEENGMKYLQMEYKKNLKNPLEIEGRIL